MDDLNLYTKSSDDLEGLLVTVKRFSENIVMQMSGQMFKSHFL